MGSSTTTLWPINSGINPAVFLPSSILQIHIRTIGEQQLSDFRVTFFITQSRIMQRCPSILILRIHIRTVSH